MAWSVGTAVETTQIGTSSPTYSLPTFVADDYIVLVIALARENANSTPALGTISVSGYTEAGTQTNTGAASDQLLAIFYRKMTGSESSTVTGSCTAPTGAVSSLCIAQRFRGGDPTTILDVAVPAFVVDTGAANSPAIDPDTAGCLVISAAVYDGNIGHSDSSIPTGTTLIGTMFNSIANGCSVGAAYEIHATADAIAAKAWNDSGSEENVAATVALRVGEDNRTITPPVGTLTLTGRQPVAANSNNNITVAPTVGSVAITVTDATFINSGDMRLILRSESPTIVVQTDQALSSSPGVGSLGLSSAAPSRAFGLQLTGQGLSISQGVGLGENPTAGSVRFTGRRPTALTQTSTSAVVAPDEGILTLSGKTPRLPITNATRALAFSSDAPTIGGSDTVEMTRAHLAIQSDELTILVADQDIGVSITNTNSTIDVPNNYDICDRTGMRVKPGTLVKDGYGHWVRPESYEPRHPQEYLRGRGERHRGAERPEPIGSETFIEDLYPSGVTADDL